MNVTFDLETLGNTANAPIVQIGAVVFDETGEPIDTFEHKCDLETIPEDKFIVDYDTLRWWMGQIAKNPSLVSVMQERIMMHETLIREFIEWDGEMLAKHGGLLYWSHATFDPPILDRHCKIYKLRRLPYTSHRDIRTLSHFAGHIDVKRQGNHHDALDDCKFQAKYIAKGLKLIREKKVYI